MHLINLEVVKIFKNTNLLVIDPQLAQVIGLIQAIILQQIQYLVNKNEERDKFYNDNYYWVRMTQKELHEQFSFLSIRTIKNHLKELRGKDLLIATNKYNNTKYLNKTLWYRINYNALEELENEFSNKNQQNKIKFLYNEHPLVFYPKLAEAIGLNESIVLQQICYWINKNKDNDRNNYKGLYWTYNSYEAWQRQFPFWSIDTVIRTINTLERLGLLLSEKKNKSRLDHTKWYTINYTRLQRLNKILEKQNFDKKSIFAKFEVQEPIKVNTDSDITDGIKKRREKREQQIKELVSDLPKKYKKITAALIKAGIEKEKAYELAQNYKNKRIRRVIYYYSMRLCYERNEIRREEVPGKIIKALINNEKIPIKTTEQIKKEKYFKAIEEHEDIFLHDVNRHRFDSDKSDPKIGNRPQ